MAAADLLSRCSEGARVGPLIVLDWDDTLLPSSWLGATGQLLGDGDGEVPCEVMERLRVCESSAVQLLETAFCVAYKVLIITNSEAGWVQRSSARFLPRTVPFLRKCSIMSARAMFGPCAPEKPLEWKLRAFAAVVSDYSYVPNSDSIIVSIGDSMLERDAVHLAAAQCGLMVAASVKFIDRPTPEQLAWQMTIVEQSIPEIIRTEKSLDLIVQLSQ